MKKLFVHYDKEDVPDAVADSPSELARMVGIKYPESINHAIKKGSKRYAEVYTEDEEC